MSSRIRANAVRLSLALGIVLFSGVGHAADARQGFVYWLLLGGEDDKAHDGAGQPEVAVSRYPSRILVIGEDDGQLIRALESAGHRVHTAADLEDVRAARCKCRVLLVDAEVDREVVKNHFANRLDAQGDVRPGLAPVFVKNVMHKKTNHYETVAMIESYLVERVERRAEKRGLRRVEAKRRFDSRTQTHYEPPETKPSVNVPNSAFEPSAARGRVERSVLLPGALVALGWLLTFLAMRRKPLSKRHRIALDAWSIPQGVATMALVLAAFVSPAFGLVCGAAFAVAKSVRNTRVTDT